jgi:hypothetical protein
MAHIRLHLKQADGHLPMVCMRCGEPASSVIPRKMSWYPRWMILFCLLGGPGLIIIVILALAVRKRGRVQVPFCDRHKRHWTVRSAIIWAMTIPALLIGIGTVIGAIHLEESRAQHAEFFVPLLFFGGLIVFVAWLCGIVIVHSTTIRPDEITRAHILLNGVSESFVDAVEEAEIERRVRLRQWADQAAVERMPHDAGKDVSPPTSGARSTDVFEEGRRPPSTPPTDAIEE